MFIPLSVSSQSSQPSINLISSDMMQDSHLFTQYFISWLLPLTFPFSLFLLGDAPSHVRQDMSENSGQQLLVRARFNFQPNNEDELTFDKGDLIGVTRQEDGGWWEGMFNGRTGWFPSNYVREIKGSGRYLTRLCKTFEP